MRTFKRCLSFLFAYGAASMAAAEPLDSALQGLLTDHPQIQSTRNQVEVARHGVKESFAGFLPRADVGSFKGFEHFNRTDTIPSGALSNRPTTNANITVTENLFNGWRTSGEYESTKLGLESAESSLNQVTQQVLFEATAAYLEVLRQQELVRLATENQDMLKHQLNLEDERVQIGSGIAVDVLQAKSRLQISTERVTAFSGGLRDAISRYTQVFGKMPEPSTMKLPLLPLSFVPATLEEAIAMAEANHPLLRANEIAADQAGIARKTARSGYYPSIDVVGNSNYDENVSGVNGEESRNSIQLRLSWQIFSGFADKARVEKAAYGYQAALENTNFVRRKVIEEVKFAWSSMLTSRQRADLLNNAVNIAGEVYGARVKLRDAGKEDALNVLDAQNEQYRAKIDASSAAFDYYNAVYRVLLAMGKLGTQKRVVASAE